MQLKKTLWIIGSVLSVLALFSCGGGGGSSSSNPTSSGVVTLSITDAKPMLPNNITNFWVQFDEVWVHQPGVGWINLPLVESPYTIDLLQFYDGNTTELVPPTKLNSGKYTQVRFVGSRAIMRFDYGSRVEDWPVNIPSGKWRTDKNFIFDVSENSAADIIIHFDLSMSLVVSGPPSNPSYKLKPVMHLFGNPLQAAIINGSIENGSFGSLDKATIIVRADTNQEEYTRVIVPKSSNPTATGFNIFWLVPNQSYNVEIDLDQDETVDCEQFVEDFDLAPGEVFSLNDGDPIESRAGICN